VNDTLFLSDAVVDADGECVYVAVHRIAADQFIREETPETEVIYRSEPCVSYTDSHRSRAPIKTHLGGALAFSPVSDELYVSIGDLHLGSSTIGQAESIGIENVEKDYAILRSPTAAVSAVAAISTPFDSATGRVFSKGLRNSLGMTVTASGEVWLSDHGPSGGDELNRIQEGADYGWPLTSLGQPYDRSSYPQDSSALPAPWLDIYQAEIPGSTPPAYSWTPAVAPTSVVEYPSKGIEQWRGTLVMSSLRAQSVIVLSQDSGNTVEQDRLGVGERIRDMAVTTSGELVMVTDSSRLVAVSD
jgi:glucose/arabinose dehydrogenase